MHTHTNQRCAKNLDKHTQQGFSLTTTEMFHTGVYLVFDFCYVKIYLGPFELIKSSGRSLLSSPPLPPLLVLPLSLT